VYQTFPQHFTPSQATAILASQQKHYNTKLFFVNVLHRKTNTLTTICKYHPFQNAGK
jgi:hypothetical protein